MANFFFNLLNAHGITTNPSVGYFCAIFFYGFIYLICATIGIALGIPLWVTLGLSKNRLSEMCGFLILQESLSSHENI